MASAVGQLFHDVGNGLKYAAQQCTAFVADVVSWVPAGWGNAGDWLSNAQKAGYTVSKTPTPGAVAVYLPNQGGASPTGHVAVVKSVQPNGLPVLEEANWSYPTNNGIGQADTRAATPTTAPSGYITGPPGGNLDTSGGGIDFGILQQIAGAAGPPGSSSVIGGVGTATNNLTDLNPIDILKNLPTAIVSALGDALAGMVVTLGQAVAAFLGTTVTDVGAFASNHVVPLAVAGVVTAALFA
jgi:surface antigen